MFEKKSISNKALKEIREHGIVLASQNQGKLQEFRDIFAPWGIDIHSIDNSKEIEETGHTFLENAQLKARETFKRSKHPTILADDSGLCIDALQGRPGIYSARYANTNDYQKKCTMLLDEMKDVTERNKRTARYICALVLYRDEQEISVQESCEGIILNKMDGDSGFGYDPIFEDRFWQKSYGKLSKEQKNMSSHRSKAARSLINYF